MKLSIDGMLTGTYKVGDGPLSAVFSDGVVYVVNNGGDSVTKLSALDDEPWLDFRRTRSDWAGGVW